MPKYKTNKGMTEEQTRNMLIEKMKGSPWVKRILQELFMW
jgi:hypothetical protein